MQTSENKAVTMQHAHPIGGHCPVCVVHPTNPVHDAIAADPDVVAARRDRDVARVEFDRLDATWRDACAGHQTAETAARRQPVLYVDGAPVVPYDALNGRTLPELRRLEEVAADLGAKREKAWERVAAANVEERAAVGRVSRGALAAAQRAAAASTPER